MKLVTDKPTGMASSETFVLMGMVEDSEKDYACLLNKEDGQLYIEEIHWHGGKQFETATLHQIDGESEWNELYKFVTSGTTIFSPTKIKDILKRGMYTYNKDYMETDDFKERKSKGLI